MTYTFWTFKERELLKKFYGDERYPGEKILILFPGRTYGAIRRKAITMKLTEPYSGQKERKEQYKALHKRGLSDLEISKILHAGQNTLRKWRKEMGLERNFAPGGRRK
jgi:hypothetical protein